jgi:tetratricopeptide (TPR) repeat protein
MKKIIIALVAICFITNTTAQSNADKALEKMMEGIKLVDDNQLDEAIKTFTEAQKLDAKNIDITYEIAHCHYTKGDYKSAIPMLEKIIKNPKAADHVYQLLGNSYDNEFKRDEALAIYKKGVEKYPNSGPLYCDMGVLHIGKKQLDKALIYFEKGIQVDATYASNYYHACKLYCASPNTIWGVLYGELFMNMDRNSGRTQEISKILFETYSRSFILENGKVQTVKFSNDSIVKIKVKSSETIGKINFSKSIFEPTMLAATKQIDAITIATLYQIRKEFAQQYAQKYVAAYPNIIFAYHQKLIDAGMLESYTYWLLNKGEIPAFKEWARENRTTFQSFLKWYKENPLLIDETHKMHRVDY